MTGNSISYLTLQRQYWGSVGRERHAVQRGAEEASALRLATKNRVFATGPVATKACDWHDGTFSCAGGGRRSTLPPTARPRPRGVLEGARNNQRSISRSTAKDALDRDPTTAAAVVRLLSFPSFRRRVRMESFGGAHVAPDRARTTRWPAAVMLSPDAKRCTADGASSAATCASSSRIDHRHGVAGHCKRCSRSRRRTRHRCMCLDSAAISSMHGWTKSGSPPAVVVVSPGGTLLETHPAPADAPMRCAFGDADLGSLYVTAADGGLYRARGIGRRGLKR